MYRGRDPPRRPVGLLHLDTYVIIHMDMIIMVRYYSYGYDYLYGYALWWVDYCWIIYMDMIIIHMLHLGGTQTGSYQTGSYQKGRFIPAKPPTLSYLLFFDTTPFICL